MPHETNETLRKFLHIAFGLGALTLLWLPWRVVAGVAVIAVIGNWLLLHRLFGRSVARHERGYDAGIVIYPAAVALLIIIFNWHLEIAAVAWVILAFGGSRGAGDSAVDGVGDVSSRRVAVAHREHRPRDRRVRDPRR